MSLNNFIPSVWAGNLLSNLNKAQVYAQAAVTNRDYEGDISAYGDRVKINQIGRVTVFDYTKNTDMPAPETLTDNQRELVIDQAKGFNFVIDDVEKAQTNPKVMGEATRESAYALSDVADQYLAGLYVQATNNIGSTAAPETFTAAGDAWEALIDLGTLLTESSVPTLGRAAVVPPWFVGLLSKDQRYTGAGAVGAQQVLANGFMGRAGGFDILVSNNVPTATDGTAGTSYKIQVSTPQARSYAEQIVETEAYRPERRFGDALKGLHVYGGKIVRPEAMAVLHVKRPTF